MMAEIQREKKEYERRKREKRRGETVPNTATEGEEYERRKKEVKYAEKRRQMNATSGKTEQDPGQLGTRTKTFHPP